MSCCLCHIPPSTLSGIQATAKAYAKLDMSIKPGNLAQLELAAECSKKVDADMSDMFGLEKAAATVPASFNAKVSGALMQVSMMMKMTPGTFALFDPITLKKELDIMTMAINRNTSSLSMIAGIKVSAMLKISAVARAVIKLKLNGLDPEDPNFVSMVNARAATALRVSAHRPTFNLKNLPKVKLIAALPTLVKAMEEMNIPVGDPNRAAPMLRAAFRPLLALQMPAVKLKMVAIIEAAAVIEAKAAIDEAFGASQRDWPLLMARINASMNMAANLKLPKMAIPIELPTPEEIKLGEEAAAKSNILRAGFSGFALPNIQFLPTINAFLALRAALGVPPLERCMSCGS